MPNILNCTGLHISENEYGLQPGALVVANNVLIRYRDKIEPRPGFQQCLLDNSSSFTAAYAIFDYQDTLLTLSSGGTLAKDNGSGGLTHFSGTYLSPDTSLVRSRPVTANQNLYFTTSGGVYRLDSLSGTPALAGGFKTGEWISLATSGSSGFLADKAKVAYRYVFGFKDANGTLYLGSPSGRGFVINSAGAARDVALRLFVPAWVNTSVFYRIYRTEQVDTSVISDLDPGDEMGLIQEAYLTSTDISNGYVDYTDDTPDDFRDAPLYTNPNSGDGILQANEPPPYCKDIAYWNNRMWFANTHQPHRFYLTLLSTASLVGYQFSLVGDSDYAFTFSSSPTDNSGTTQVQTTGTVGEQLEFTARQIVAAINQRTGNTTYRAFYLSGPDDLPGKIMIENVAIGGGQFFFNTDSSIYGNFIPDLTSSLARNSDNDTAPNRVFFSKPNQPESVPLVNYFDVGSKNKAILRIYPTRDKLFVFKEDEGIYTISDLGTGEFRCDLLDNTVSIIAPETAASVNNQIYFLSRQGVCSASEGGVQIVSRAIESEVSAHVADLRRYNRDVPFGIGWETHGLYLLWKPPYRFTGNNLSDKYNEEAWCYNIRLGVWTKWLVEARCGAVKKLDDYLYTGSTYGTGFSYVAVNRTKPGFDLGSFGDIITPKTITQSGSYANSRAVDTNGTAIDITFSASHGLNVGDTLVPASSTAIGRVTAVVSSTVATVTGGSTFVSAAVDTKTYSVYRRVDSEIVWSAFTGGDPSLAKSFREIDIHSGTNFVESPTLTFATELVSTPTSVTISFPQDYSQLTTGATTTSTSTSAIPVHRRVLTPKEQSRGARIRYGLSVNEASAYFQILGISPVVTPTSERNQK